MSEILNLKPIKYSIRASVWVGLALAALWAAQQAIVALWATFGS